MGTIINAANRSIALPGGTYPDVSGALFDWFQPLTFEQVTKTTVAFQDVESTVPISFFGIIQPLKPRELMIRSEGERAWSWFRVFATPALVLNVDDVGIFNGKQTRVMARIDYELAGYIEYQWVQDWTGAGPNVPVVDHDYDGGTATTTAYDIDLDGGNASITGDVIDGGNAFAS